MFWVIYSYWFLGKFKQQFMPKKIYLKQWVKHHEFTLPMLHCEENLNVLAYIFLYFTLTFVNKQAGTCISCEDLSVYKEWLIVKRDGIYRNFVISKKTFKSLSYAQCPWYAWKMSKICPIDIWDMPEKYLWYF